MKFSYKLLDKLNIAKLSSSQMDLLLYLVQYQDESGTVYGVHYADVVKATGMVKQSFYSALKALEEYDLVRTVKDKNSASYTVRIKDNSFVRGTDDYKKGYINLQRKVFHSQKFKKLKTHEKFLVLYLYKRTHDDQASFKIKPKNLYENLRKMFGVTDRVIRSYLHNIRQFFSIGIVKGKYFITFKVSVFREKISTAERYFKDHSTVNDIMHRLKIRNTNDDEIHNMTELIQQYRHSAELAGEKLKEVIYNLVWTLTKDQKQKERRFNYKYINTQLHKHFSEGMHIDSPSMYYPDGSINEKYMQLHQH